MSRDEFEELLNAMKRAGLIDVENAEFEKDGEVIQYRRISLTDAGDRGAPDHAAALADQRRGGRGVHGRACVSGPEEESGFGGRGNKGNGSKSSGSHGESAALTRQAQALAERLREWRAAEAKRLRVPSFVVLHDRTLTEVARVRPGNPNQLLAIDGIGSAKAEKFGAAILALCGTEDH